MAKIKLAFAKNIKAVLISKGGISILKGIRRVAAINDMSGVGRCSLTVAIPVISAMGICVNPMPTAILSAHTGLPGFTFYDFTENMEAYYKNWADLKLNFDGIYTGFLGSGKQIKIVNDFLVHFSDGAKILVDPVMGDNGEVYKTYTLDMCKKMRELTHSAQIITPNLTEACILLSKEFDQNIKEATVKEYLKKLCESKTNLAVITGLELSSGYLTNYAYDKECDQFYISSVPKLTKKGNAEPFCGTGDLFASVLCGALVSGDGNYEALKRATDFVYEAIQYTLEIEEDYWLGVAFEPILYKLRSNI